MSFFSSSSGNTRGYDMSMCIRIYSGGFLFFYILVSLLFMF